MLNNNVVDLFSGCGGFSYGFQEAGFNIILGVDNEKIALETFKKNHYNSTVEMLDLSNIGNIRKIAAFIDNNKGADIIIAGPPCQGFSLTGPRDKNDARNTLFYSVFHLANTLIHKPKVIVIENVIGLAKLYKGKAKEDILNEFEKNGYECTFSELYAPDFGVPQIRKRVFFVGVLKELGKFYFPDKIYSEEKYVSCEEAIGDLPALVENLGQESMNYNLEAFSEYQKLMRKNSNKLYNHVGTKHTEDVINVISQVPEGGNHKDLPKDVGNSRKFNEAWTRYHSKKPSKTIDTGHRNHFHYKWNRVPTVRENARLQSFPDNFIFIGTKTQQYRQVGNAVPPLLGFHIAKKIKDFLNEI